MDCGYDEDDKEGDEEVDGASVKEHHRGAYLSAERRGEVGRDR